MKKEYKSYNPNSRRYGLCLHAKLKKVFDLGKNVQRKRSEVHSQFRHQNKFILITLVVNKKIPDYYIKKEVTGVHKKTVLKMFQNPFRTI